MNIRRDEPAKPAPFDFEEFARIKDFEKLMNEGLKHFRKGKQDRE